jgi:hypothetical protein
VAILGENKQDSPRLIPAHFIPGGDEIIVGFEPHYLGFHLAESVIMCLV